MADIRNSHPDVIDDDLDESSADEDFDPTKVDVQDDELSSSDDDHAQDATAKPGKRPRKRKQQEAGDLDSGDEATIQELRRSRKKKASEDEDSGGEGGLIKTRAQRRAQKEEKRKTAAVATGEVTVDVDALWAKLSSAPVGRPPPPQPEPQTDALPNGEHAATGLATAGRMDSEDVDIDGARQPDAPDDEMITIKRTYDFAGERVVEEKRVHKNTAEAKLYLASTDRTERVGSDPPATPDGQPALRRPLKRASLFEPNPTGEVKGLPADRHRLRTPSRAEVLALQKRLEEEAEKKARAQKVNTVQKSAMDWAAHVDAEGLQEELGEYGRSKQGYMGKMDFLRNVEGRREEESRRVRMMR